VKNEIEDERTSHVLVERSLKRENANDGHVSESGKTEVATVRGSRKVFRYNVV